MDDRAVRERVARVEEALEALERLPGAPRETALDAVAVLLELYGEGWARALALFEAERPGASAALAGDELVAHLLMIHGLHPDEVETRVRFALEEVRAAVDGGGARVELLGVEDGVARLRLAGNGNGAGAGFRDLVERAVLRAAPELEAVEVERPSPPPAPDPDPPLVQLRGPGQRAGGSSGASAGERLWPKPKRG